MNKSMLIKEVTFLLERIPDEKIPEAQEALRELIARLDSIAPSMTNEEFINMLENAPEDDEEVADEERMAIDEAVEEIKAGKATPIDDLFIENGLL